MSTVKELKVGERDNTLNPRQLRAAGYTPATIYGKDCAPQCIQVNAHEFTLAALQGTRQFKLTGFITGNAKVSQIQVNPLKNEPISIEFVKQK